MSPILCCYSFSVAITKYIMLDTLEFIWLLALDAEVKDWVSIPGKGLMLYHKRVKN